MHVRREAPRPSRRMSDMAGTKEIRQKIKSVQNTRKITKAMEMVAASKMRKAQDRMRQFRPYGDKIRNIVAHLALANPEYRPPFMQKRDVDERRRDHPGHDRQGSVRRAEHQHPARGAAADQGTRCAGRQGPHDRDRQPRLRVPAAAQCQRRVALRADRRPPASGKADRAGQGADRHVRRWTHRRGLRRLLALRQHDEAGAGDRAAAAAVL